MPTKTKKPSGTPAPKNESFVRDSEKPRIDPHAIPPQDPRPKPKKNNS